MRSMRTVYTRWSGPRQTHGSLPHSATMADWSSTGSPVHSNTISCSRQTTHWADDWTHHRVTEKRARKEERWGGEPTVSDTRQGSHTRQTLHTKPGTTDNYRLCHTVTWPLVQCTCQRWWRASSCQEPGSPIQDGVMVDITGDWQILYPMDGQGWDLQTVLKGVVFSVLLRTANSQLHTLHVNSRCVMLLYLPLRFVVG